MNKIAVVGSIAAVGVVAAGAGALVATDGYIDKALVDAEQSLGSTMSMDVLQDNNSLFGRELDIQFSMAEGEDLVTFVVENDISKMPWGASVQHNLKVSALTSETLDSSGDIKTWFDENLKDQVLLTGSTNVSLTGSYNTVLESFEKNETLDEVELAIGKVTINVNGDVSGGLDVEGDWAGLQVTAIDGESGTAQIKPITFMVKGQYLGSQLFVGEQVFKMGGLSLSSQESSGDMEMDVSELEISMATDVSDEQLTGSLGFKVEQLMWQADGEGLTIADVNANIALKGLNVANVQTALNELNQLEATMEMTPELTESANGLLRNGLRLELGNWSAKVEEYDFSMDAFVELPENQVADVSNPFSFIGLVAHVKASADLAFDSGLADIPELSDGVMAMLMSGALVNDADGYKMSFKMENGKPLLNGEALPLPF